MKLPARLERAELAVDPRALTWALRGDLVVIRTRGYLNRRLGRDVSRLVAQILGGGRRDFVVDLEGCELVNHAGLAELFALQDRVRRDRGTLRLRGGTPTVRKILRILGYRESPSSPAIRQAAILSTIGSGSSTQAK